MVDRIVPAATPETLADVEKLLGVADSCGIATESFRQWVIEDNFVAGHPDWAVAGAQLVKDVIPYEDMKLRMLNGSHSFLAYLGYLGGYQHIDETMTDANYRNAAFTLMTREQAPTLNMPEKNRSGRLRQSADHPFLQPEPETPYLADRDGWHPEAAAAYAELHPFPPEKR